MIEGIELNIYFKNGENISFDLTATQTKTMFKALGLHINPKTQEMTAFSDESLKKHILPKVNFKPVDSGETK